jgi:hypothetical protein
MEIPNIHTVVDGGGLGSSASEFPRLVALLLLPGNPDESEQQERFDH